MNQSKHTPGPWVIEESSANFVSITSDTARCIADVWALDSDCSIEERDANASLIAASPKLLSVAEKIAKWNKDYPPSRVYGYGDIKQIAAEMKAINEEALAAIAEAKGAAA